MKTFLKRLQPQNRVAIQLAFIFFAAGSIACLLLFITGEKIFQAGSIGVFIIALITNAMMFLIVLLNYVLGFVSHKEALFTLYVIVLSVSLSLLLLFI
ncbi:hypothetical protein LX97_00142 [Nonlabens dokdonensis]|jgi:hypothetical protein|uniref:Uncharacterized protein n=2 Tax=Nonlabens dokdonensis TaxID=328515 RepID=L7W6N3_NONDD|nr:hypothetical protein [Nonlabens dokdonensis]AGC75446.1 hypothetical protein DDD_0319 [Nonlabens dokdonensis DSW-6]PZX43143.1 hypothetical protein LX97_00142 [Nonlabens dokdonensis]